MMTLEYRVDNWKAAERNAKISEDNYEKEKKNGKDLEDKLKKM